MGQHVNMHEVDKEVDLENSIWLIEKEKGTPIGEQIWAPFEVEQPHLEIISQL